MAHTQCTKCGQEPTSIDKWRWSIYTAILFFIIVNPFTYTLVQKLLGSLVKIADANGCPTISGIVVHTIVFTVLVRGLMDMNI
jgi:hypothetical protein